MSGRSSSSRQNRRFDKTPSSPATKANRFVFTPLVHSRVRQISGGAFAGLKPQDMVIDSIFVRDSVVALTAACGRKEFLLMQLNVFDFELLYDK
jgi:hypothetical protein